MIIYLLKNYNNYYNRIIKREPTLADYITAVGNDGYAKRGTSATVAGGYGPVNFNVNDSITATCTYNYVDGQDWQPDYVLCVDDTDTNIIYRYFVMEAVRTRKYQYSLTLRRDIVADNYTKVVNAPMFIEKATLNVNSPYVFNKENVTFNQIKSDDGEYLLKDATNTPWIIGYMAKAQDNEANTEINHHIVTRAAIETSDYSDLNDFLLHYDSDLAQLWNYNQHAAQVVNLADWYYDVPFLLGGTSDFGVFSVNIGNKLGSYKGAPATTPTSYGTTWSSYTVPQLVEKLNNELNNYSTGANLQIATSNYLSQTASLSGQASQNWIDNLIDRYNNKTIDLIISGNHNYYKLSITKSGTAIPASGYDIYEYSIDTPTAQLGIDMYAVYNNIFGFTLGSTFNNHFYLKNSEGYVYKYTLSYAPASAPNADIKTTVSKDRRPLDDAPYCMFAIPWNDLEFKLTGSTISSQAIYNRAIASAIVEKMASKVYDLQLLPYCPYRQLIGPNGEIDIRLAPELVEGDDYSYIKNSSDQKIGIILWPHQSSDTFDINYLYTMPQDATTIKVENETKMYRLCSPNYAAIYEFSPVKNNGISKFNVDFTYKPYVPYIHINPDFGGLYGQDWNDARGLICAGDFSLPQTTDQWAQFEINNKNYQNSFNRQIDSMDKMHEFDKTERAWKMAAGVVGGAVGGAKLIGNAAGAALGAGVAAIGGAVDWQLAEGRYSEQKSYAIDQFNMNLENVQARPDTLSKVSAYNNNNKLWPFIEYYHATQEEEIAFRNKLKYNGMTVGVIGTINEYLQPDYSFIKGKLIRLENSGLEFHEQMQLAQELEEGVFIK